MPVATEMTGREQAAMRTERIFPAGVVTVIFPKSALHHFKNLQNNYNKKTGKCG